MGLFSAIADLAKFGHDETVGRVLDFGTSQYQSSKAARRQYQLSRDLWKYQISNAHQLEVEDLRKAGINPILTAGNLSSAHGGTVAGQVVSSDRRSNWKPSESIANAMNVKVAQEQIKKLDAETKATNALTQDYIASAKQKNEATETIARENAYMRAHPDLYDVKQANQAGGFPVMFARGMQALTDNSYSAKQNATAVKNYRRGYFYEDSK